MVEEWVRVHGYVCPGCPISGWQWHVADRITNPLTADHVVSVAEGGAEDGPLRVMCHRGNSALGATARRNPP
jgi:hypothetical protein